MHSPFGDKETSSKEESKRREKLEEKEQVAAFSKIREELFEEGIQSRLEGVKLDEDEEEQEEVLFEQKDILIKEN